MFPLKNKHSALLCLLLASYAPLGLAERADREKPIQMSSDRAMVDDLNKTSTFEGHVQVRQGTLLIEADKIIVTQDQQGANQMTATGQLAHFRQKRDGINEYAEGFGERIVYDGAAETVNFYGQARVKRDGDDVRGEHIFYNTKTGIFQVFGSNEQKISPNGKEGQVIIVIQPKNKPQESAPNTPAPITPPTTPSKPKS
jgi:lipopolysaccharide export system protein LptA